jgi:hypothetical protein
MHLGTGFIRRGRRVLPVLGPLLEDGVYSVSKVYSLHSLFVVVFELTNDNKKEMEGVCR